MFLCYNILSTCLPQKLLPIYKFSEILFILFESIFLEGFSSDCKDPVLIGNPAIWKIWDPGLCRFLRLVVTCSLNFELFTCVCFQSWFSRWLPLWLRPSSSNSKAASMCNLCRSWFSPFYIFHANFFDLLSEIEQFLLGSCFDVVFLEKCWWIAAIQCLCWILVSRIAFKRVFSHLVSIWTIFQ